MASSEGLLSKHTFSKLEHQWIDEDEFADHVQYIQRSKRRNQLRLSFMHFLIFLAYAGVFSTVYIRYVCPRKSELNMVWSPANHVLRYRPQYLNNDVFVESVWKGKPRPDHDEAWEDLFKYMNIRVSKEELDRMNQTSVQLTDGSGDYLAGVDVLHNLHCVKTIRHFIFGSSRPGRVSEQVSNLDHIDHCLDSLRQEIACRAEATMYTFEWRQDIQYPWAQLSFDHTCADFDALMDWASERAVDITSPGLLDHPEAWRFAGQDHSNQHGHSH